MKRNNSSLFIERFFSISNGFSPLIFSVFFLFLLGCKSWDIFREKDKFEQFRSYENDYGSRIELYLELAEQELVENYKRKEYLMIREDQPRAVLHPRKDLTLRELVKSAYEENHISEEQKSTYIKKCDRIYSLWEKHWRSADKKARQLGFER